MNIPLMNLLRARVGVAIAALLLLVAGAAWADPPGRVVRLAYISGGVSFLPAGDNDWVQAAINRPLWMGDKLWTGGGARAELQMGDAALRLAPETSLSVVNFDDRTEQFQVNQGTVDVHVRSLEGALEIDTPNLAFSIRGPGQYRVDVSADATTVAVVRGEAEAFGTQAAYVINAGERFSFRGTDLNDYQPVAITQGDAFDAWAAERTSTEERSVSARYVSPDVIGYADLDAHGTWSNVPTYGAVWVPRDVAADWAPYRDGHWAWVDPWGWTWVDAAPWGFAPFHYGRWAFVQSRWCWVPGPRHERPVYAPALVAFVGGSNFGVSVGVGGGGGRRVVPARPGRRVSAVVQREPRLLHAGQCHQYRRERHQRHERLQQSDTDQHSLLQHQYGQRRHRGADAGVHRRAAGAACRRQGRRAGDPAGICGRGRSGGAGEDQHRRCGSARTVAAERGGDATRRGREAGAAAGTAVDPAARRSAQAAARQAARLGRAAEARAAERRGKAEREGRPAKRRSQADSRNDCARTGEGRAGGRASRCSRRAARATAGRGRTAEGAGAACRPTARSNEQRKAGAAGSATGSEGTAFDSTRARCACPDAGSASA